MPCGWLAIGPATGGAIGLKRASAHALRGGHAIDRIVAPNVAHRPRAGRAGPVPRPEPHRMTTDRLTDIRHRLGGGGHEPGIDDRSMRALELTLAVGAILVVVLLTVLRAA